MPHRYLHTDEWYPVLLLSEDEFCSDGFAEFSDSELTEILQVQTRGPSSNSLSINEFSCLGAINRGKRAPSSDADFLSLFDAPLRDPRIKLWEVSDIVALWEAVEPKAGKRGTYKKQTAD